MHAAFLLVCTVVSFSFLVEQYTGGGKYVTVSTSADCQVFP